MELDESDGNIVPRNRKPSYVIKWPDIPHSKLVTLLFLLDNGDKTTGSMDTYRKWNIGASLEAKEAFLSVLKANKYSFWQVLEVLRRRVKELVQYPFIRLEGDTEAANRAVRKQDEYLLTMVEACRYLHIDCFNLENKIKKVQEKLFLSEEEKMGKFFLYAENLQMKHICDSLTPSLVCQLLDVLKRDKNLSKLIDKSIDVPLDKLNKIEGLKEALFFYMIRVLEDNEKLNRLYTGKLQELLNKVNKETKDEHEQRTIMTIVNALDVYPIQGRPAGHCVVFCVTKDREGSQGEINKVKRVFSDSLGYTVHIEKDPTYKTLEEYRKTLQKQKYHFYDSIVFWFMAHGTETNIKLADGYRYKRMDIIDSFSRLDNFRKKPKIFFMTSCRGRATISIREKGGVRVAVDGSHEGQTYSVIPEQCCNITAVYYQMDRIIASATLPEHYAFRLPDGGSVYVDTVCRLLEQHRGHNFTQVLERVCNKIHQILFSCHEKFPGEAKQACYYESTFQKTFIVPGTPKATYY
ncbi:caspase-12-like [Homarus americanus]|uniref:caspase-12-like n=1 Tax=Homarus americanus TaxID=6706 RepID=UPI001C484569|nr:caspase-12-like [Homarus americanus]